MEHSIPICQTSGQTSPKQAQDPMKACILYALNDLLFRGGKITVEKKQAVDFEIWKQYHF